VSAILLSGQRLTETDLLRVVSTMDASTPEEATSRAVEFTAERLGAPAAGWVSSSDPAQLELVGVRGLSSEASDRVLDTMSTIQRSDVTSFEGLQRAAARFAEIARVERGLQIEAGGAIILVAAGPSMARGTVSLVTNMLETTLGRLAAMATAERRNDHLDLSVAWTAHEIKSPLLGAMAALERARLSPGEDADELLGRAHRELSQLAELVDDLLSWAVVGGSIVATGPADLVSLVREAVEACDLQGSERVRLLSPATLTVQASRPHLRSALSNVIRNALLYSPRDSAVTVTVTSREGLAWITIHDEGAGIQESEREWVFDPFTRGVESPRGGKGLGLFVTRRIIEAHEGSIWIEPSEEGTPFKIQLPAQFRTEGEG
jgi:signal transduction histidine kinase